MYFDTYVFHLKFLSFPEKHNRTPAITYLFLVCILECAEEMHLPSKMDP